MVVYPGPCPWYQFLHSIVASQTLSACRYIETHSQAITEGSTLEAFLHSFLKDLATGVHCQDSFDSVDEKRARVFTF